MAKKIGFRIDDPDENAPQEKSSPLEDVFGVSKIKTVAIICRMFSPNGISEDLELLSSTDIICQLSDLLSINKSTLYTVMSDLGFQLKFIEGVPLWKVYPIQEAEDL